MKTILVPVDFSAVSAEIVDSAASFARTFGGRVVLLHVVQPPIITSEYALPVEAAQDAIAEEENSANTRLAEYTEVFGAAGVSVAAIVRHGPPVHAILDEATKVQADFIIMGSHGHGSLYDLLVGSTANGVLRGARCGVIIMPPADKRAKVAPAHRHLVETT